MTKEKKTILFVDDEPDILFFMQILFVDKCQAVYTAESGNKALAVLARHPVDIMITDLRMPGMDGLELIKKARQLLPELRCMMVTGHGEQDIANSTIELEITDYFNKPINVEEMQIAIDR